MKPKKTEVVVKPDAQIEAAYNAWTSEENRGNYQANLTDFDMEDKSHKTEEGLEVRLLLSPSGERKFREFASTKGMENMKLYRVLPTVEPRDFPSTHNYCFQEVPAISTLLESYIIYQEFLENL